MHFSDVIAEISAKQEMDDYGVDDAMYEDDDDEGDVEIDYDKSASNNTSTRMRIKTKMILRPQWMVQLKYGQMMMTKRIVMIVMMMLRVSR